MTGQSDYEQKREAVARGICMERAPPACNCKSTGVCKAPLENLFNEHNPLRYQADAALTALGFTPESDAPTLASVIADEACECAELAVIRMECEVSPKCMRGIPAPSSCGAMEAELRLKISQLQAELEKLGHFDV